MPTPPSPIPAGYVLLARKLLESELMGKPPLYAKLWMWMILRAEWRPDSSKLSRGQFVATISDMQEAMSYRAGYRKITPTKDEIRNAYEAFTKATMITTTKTTRGMIITICNYEYYQNPKNYEAHKEPHNEKVTGTTVTPHGSKEVKEVKKETKTLKPIAQNEDFEPSGPESLFDQFWKAYPKKVAKGAAQKAWKKIKCPAHTLPLIIEALQWQKGSAKWQENNGEFVPHPATYLNQRRWEDEKPVDVLDVVFGTSPQGESSNADYLGGRGEAIRRDVQKYDY